MLAIKVLYLTICLPTVVCFTLPNVPRLDAADCSPGGRSQVGPMHFAEVTADIITLCQQYLLFSFFMRLQSDRYHYPKATGVLVGCKLVQCLVKIVESYRGRELPTSEYIVGDVQYKPGPLRLAAWHYWYLTWGQYAVPGSRLKLKAYNT